MDFVPQDAGSCCRMPILLHVTRAKVLMCEARSICEDAKNPFVRWGYELVSKTQDSIAFVRWVIRQWDQIISGTQDWPTSPFGPRWMGHRPIVGSTSIRKARGKPTIRASAGTMTKWSDFHDMLGGERVPKKREWAPGTGCNRPISLSLKRPI